MNIDISNIPVGVIGLMENLDRDHTDELLISFKEKVLLHRLSDGNRKEKLYGRHIENRNSRGRSGSSRTG